MRRVMDRSGTNILREIFASRAEKRPYSLRAFARDLGISHTYLSLVLNDKKKLPLATLKSLSAKLGLDTERVSSLNESDVVDKQRFSQLEIDKFRLMSLWYYTAILELLEVEGFHFSLLAVAEYFTLSLEDVREAVTVLKRLGLIEKRGDTLRKCEGRLSIIPTVSLEAVRAYHRQMILQAVEELEKTAQPDFKLRDITGITMPINPARIAGAKRRIARFRRSLESYLTRGKCTEVYQFNIQLFTLRGKGRRK